MRFSPDSRVQRRSESCKASWIGGGIGAGIWIVSGRTAFASRECYSSRPTSPRSRTSMFRAPRLVTSLLLATLACHGAATQCIRQLRCAGRESPCRQRARRWTIIGRRTRWVVSRSSSTTCSATATAGGTSNAIIFVATSSGCTRAAIAPSRCRRWSTRKSICPRECRRSFSPSMTRVRRSSAISITTGRSRSIRTARSGIWLAFHKEHPGLAEQGHLLHAIGRRGGACVLR